MTIPAIAKYARGAVVSIIMSGKDGSPIAQGSGFLISKDGLILTNYHVIESGSSAIVKLPDGAFFAVDGLLAFDKARDVAIIKAHGEDFRTLTLGNSDQLQVGEEVVAIGNPLSLESTVSNGIISGIRTVEEEGGKFLQVTTPISPGSSGGPLFNMAGEVVGITTLYLKGGENLNFAIPINDAKRLLLANPSKVQALPNETEPVKAQTHDADAPAQQGAALGDAFKIDEVDCTQYQNAGGCQVWNQLVRSKNVFIVSHLMTWKETYVWFDPRGGASEAGIFVMVSFTWHDNNQLIVGRWTYIPGFGDFSKSPTLIDLETKNCSDPAACEAHGVKYDEMSAEGERCEVQLSPTCEDGFRDLSLTAGELGYTIGFSKGRKHGGEVQFSEVFSRSTGGFAYTDWSSMYNGHPGQMVGTQFRRAALYRLAALQK
jgi:hypothetical protein